MPTAIGPHNGIELDLMLAGKKPLARFSKELPVGDYEVGDEAFAQFVDAGFIKRFVFNEGPCEYRYYCHPTEEWRVKVLELIRRVALEENKGGFTEDDLHRVDGALLGYEKTDVEQFVAHASRIRESRG
jgi:hypothetical protein